MIGLSELQNIGSSYPTKVHIKHPEIIFIKIIEIRLFMIGLFKIFQNFSKDVFSITLEELNLPGNNIKNEIFRAM